MSRDSIYNGQSKSPILGNGTYWAFSEEHAREYGPNIESKKLDLSNPLIIDNDRQFDKLTDRAGWRTYDPAPCETDALKKLIQHMGHDGVIVTFPDTGDAQIGIGTYKTLRSLFGTPQVVEYTR